MNDIRLLIIGFGYTAATIARIALASGASVTGTVRHPRTQRRLREAGLDARLLMESYACDDARAAAIEATHVVVTVPPGEADRVLPVFGDEVFAPPRPLWVGYLSSVSVYGDHEGAWVDEASELRSRLPRGIKRREAEVAWTARAEAAGVPIAILRLAGIYGPARNQLAKVFRGAAHRIAKPGHVSNRIHVEDVGLATVGAAVQGASGVFNLADDNPAPPADVVAYAAGLMGVPPPPEQALADAGLEPMEQSFYLDNRRVANAKIKRELGLSLRFPSYREGLDALWRGGTWRG